MVVQQTGHFVKQNRYAFVRKSEIYQDKQKIILGVKKEDRILMLRQMAAAFLLNEEQEVLLLQKKSEDTFLAGLLVPIGGHIESYEINDPKKACFREIEEETGLKKEFIENLKLKYIMLRNSQNQEIRVQYVFFGTISKNATLRESDEGPLEWVKFREIVNKNISSTTNEIIKHYNDMLDSNDDIYVGSMKSLNGKPTVTWGILQDWEELRI